MRYLVLSDVHANATALTAVLKDAERRGFDAVLFLGDAVGYYPEPEEVVTRLAELGPTVALMGNHDSLLLALRRGEDPEEGRTSPIVRPVLSEQIEALSAASIAWLESLVPHHLDERFEAVHGALARKWQYLHGLDEAEENLDHLQRPLCLVGHTHVPRVLASAEAPGGRRLWRQVSFRQGGGNYRLPPRARGFFNPGSVGQPRDGHPSAAYGLYEPESARLEVVRVPYDVAEVQRSVRRAGYPDALAGRLALGR